MSAIRLKWPLSGFNPHPPRRVGDATGADLRGADLTVSIHTHPGGWVMQRPLPLKPPASRFNPHPPRRVGDAVPLYLVEWQGVLSGFARSMAPRTAQTLSFCNESSKNCWLKNNLARARKYRDFTIAWVSRSDHERTFKIDSLEFAVFLEVVLHWFM